MIRGRVKWFSKDKGYGFVVPDDKGGDIFVHSTTVLASKMKTEQMRDDARVLVEIVDHKGRPRASSIQIDKAS